MGEVIACRLVWHVYFLSHLSVLGKSMGCIWEAQLVLNSIDGVCSTVAFATES